MVVQILIYIIIIISPTSPGWIATSGRAQKERWTKVLTPDLVKVCGQRSLHP